MTFLGAEIGLIVMSRRMAGDSRWRCLSTYAVATGTAVLLLFLARAAASYDRPAHRSTCGGACSSGCCSQCGSPARSSSR